MSRLSLKRAIITGAILAVVVFGLHALWGGQKTNEVSGAIEQSGRFAHIEIIPDVARDAIPPLDEPEYELANQVSEWLSDDDVILGVTFNGDARAYPVKIMNWHEIVNEYIGGAPVVITYCPLCNSGIVFSRRLGNHELSFGNTGSLFESAMVMYDRETNSEWYQVAGEAITGELLGQRLHVLPSTLTTWGEWRDLYPRTRVLSIDTGHERDYLTDNYEGYDELYSKSAFPVSHDDDRLPPKEKVIGIEINGRFKAYPLREHPDQIIMDNFAENTVIIDVNAMGTSGTAYLLVKGKRTLAPTTNTFWFAWAAAYPETEIFGQ